MSFLVFHFAEFVFILFHAVCVMSQAVANCKKVLFPVLSIFFLISQELCTGTKLLNGL